MEFEQKTSKLVIIFAVINLLAAILGFVTVIILGAVSGLTVFIVTVILLPIIVQYAYLSKKTKENE